MFNTKFYPQLKLYGSASAYANIFMTEFEQKYIYLLIRDKSTHFLAILISLCYGANLKKHQKDFVNELNQRNPSLMFEYKFDC